MIRDFRIAFSSWEEGTDTEHNNGEEMRAEESKAEQSKWWPTWILSKFFLDKQPLHHKSLSTH